MPNWKKIIVSGSDASLSSAYIEGNLTASAAFLTSASIGHLETIYETASVIYTSGSTKFGDTSDDTHERTGSLLVSGAVTAHSFNISSDAVGTPSIYSDSNINLSASNAVVITSSPLRLASFTNAETGSITAQVGDIIYNSNTATYDLYSGSWFTILNETSTASKAEFATTASHALNVPSTASHSLTSVTASHTTGTASIANLATTASHALNVPNTASHALTAVSSSFTTTASYAEYAVSASHEIVLETSSSFAETASLSITASHTAGTASIANFATTASHIVTASFADRATTASMADLLSQLATASHALTSISASHSVTSSHVQEGDGIFSGSFSGSFQGDASQLNVNPFPFTGSGEMQGTLIVESFNDYVDDYVESYFAGTAIRSDGDIALTGSIFGAYQSANSFTGSFLNDTGYIVLTEVSESLNFANDSSAQAGGVPLGGLYRNGSDIKIRIT